MGQFMEIRVGEELKEDLVTKQVTSVANAEAARLRGSNYFHVHRGSWRFPEATVRCLSEACVWVSASGTNAGLDLTCRRNRRPCISPLAWGRRRLSSCCYNIWLIQTRPLPTGTRHCTSLPGKAGWTWHLSSWKRGLPSP